MLLQAMALSIMYDLILANFARHVNLNEDEQQAVIDRLQPKTYQRREKVLNAGGICKAISFVVKGCLRMYHTDDDANEHIVNFFAESWWAADVASLYSQKPAFYAIDALEDTDVLRLGIGALEELYSFSPKFERFFRILTQNGFVVYQRRMSWAISRPAKDRYHYFQKLFPDLEQRIAQKYIASYLGITPEFLSTMKKQKAKR